MKTQTYIIDVAKSLKPFQHYHHREQSKFLPKDHRAGEV